MGRGRAEGKEGDGAEINLSLDGVGLCGLFVISQPTNIGNLSERDETNIQSSKALWGATSAVRIFVGKEISLANPDNPDNPDRFPCTR